MGIIRSRFANCTLEFGVAPPSEAGNTRSRSGARRSGRTAVKRRGMVFSSRSLTGFVEPLEQLNLAGMIDVVKGDAQDGVKGGPFGALDRSVEMRHWNLRDRSAQGFVQFVEQRKRLLPLRGPGGPEASGRRGEPVGAFVRKASTLAAGEALPHGVFPVGGVEHFFPDVVAARGGPPSGLRGSQPAEAAAEVGAVPGVMVEGLVQSAEQGTDGFCGSDLARTWHGTPVAGAASDGAPETES